MKALRNLAARIATPVMRRAARAYIAGTELADGLRVVQQVERRGFTSTLGFWDGENDSPRTVANAYIDALRGMRQSCGDSYLSIKLPALAYSQDLLHEVMQVAQTANTRIHFDSLGPETVDRTRAAIEKLKSGSSSMSLSVSLPGRWRRSLRDSDWAVEMGIGIRIIKGQWEDQDGDESCLDPHRGFLNLVKHASQRSGQAVATHDPHLAAESLDIMKASGARAEIELLFGLPSRGVLALAKKSDTPVRIYVPYGHAWLPYCMAQAQKNPRVLWWMLKDSLFARGAAV